MKKYIAAITYRDSYGWTNTNPWYTFEATNISEANSIVMKIISTDFKNQENVISILDTVTKKKMSLLWQASAELLDRYMSIRFDDSISKEEHCIKYNDWLSVSKLENQISHWGNPYFNFNHEDYYYHK